jgi:hypothetical protein
MPAHSRSKNGVASLAYVAGIRVAKFGNHGRGRSRTPQSGLHLPVLRLGRDRARLAKNLFFDEITEAPRAEPRVLTASERAAL